jgi:hypothetical protein
MYEAKVDTSQIVATVLYIQSGIQFMKNALIRLTINVKTEVNKPAFILDVRGLIPSSNGGNLD